MENKTFGHLKHPVLVVGEVISNLLYVEVLLQNSAHSNARCSTTYYLIPLGIKVALKVS